MADPREWLEQIASGATILAVAYRLRLDGFWWLNLLFLVLPAVLSTAAAIVGALEPSPFPKILELPVASALAGAAAILLAIHKALKCDEFQAECLRLEQIYRSIGIAADSALAGPAHDHDSQRRRLTEKLELLSESAKAQPPTRLIRRAEAMSKRSR